MKFIVGVDLAQTNDFTALCVIEQKKIEDSHTYSVRHLERFRHVTYPDQVTRLGELYTRLRREGHEATLVVDKTGVGAAVTDMMRAVKLPCYGVTITAGDTVTRDGWNYRTPKRDLATTVQVLLQSQRLKIASNLKEAQTLVSELLAFKVAINLKTGHDSYGNDVAEWRENPHDDLVLAVACALWWAEAGTRKTKTFVPPSYSTTIFG